MGQSRNLQLTTSPPFDISTNVFPTVITPTTPAKIVLTNNGDDSINCIPAKLSIDQSTQQVISRNNLSPTVSPCAGGASITINNIFFDDPKAVYALSCQSQSSPDLKIDIPL